MDDKKKFEIEFDDDFDSWLAQHEQATKDLKPSAQPAPSMPVQPSNAVPADIPIQRRPVQQTPVQPAAGIPVQPRPAVPADIPMQRRPVQQRPAAPVQQRPAAPAPSAPVQQRPVAPAPSAPVQQRPATPAKTVSAEVPELKPDSNKFKPVESNSGTDVAVSRSEVVKNFKVQITDEDFNKPAYEEPEQPVKRDKSIYFAGRKPAKFQADSRNAMPKTMAEDKNKRAVSMQSIKEKAQMDAIRTFLVIFAIVVSSIAFSTYGISCMNDVLALNRSKELVMVNIEKGADYEDIIDTLGENGLIKHKWFCKLICKFRGFDEKTYLNGMHYLTADMGVEGMLTEMLANQTSDKTIRLSFPEGWSLPQIISKLDENNVCPAEYIYAALEEVEFDYEFINSIPDDGSRSYALEGYLFPDTYDFFVSEKQNGIGENPTSIINKLLGNFESRWSEVYTKRAKELGLTMDEVIIIASIIQKEAADKSQMGVVSSVIHNRLNNASAFPLLECNSTKDYVTNHLVPVLGDAGASAYLVSYDTYNAAGLPPGPICNPGVDAIEAALNPDDTDYLYFCHNEEGKIYLAKTYTQHQSNWAQALRDNEAN